MSDKRLSTSLIILGILLMTIPHTLAGQDVSILYANDLPVLPEGRLPNSPLEYTAAQMLIEYLDENSIEHTVIDYDAVRLFDQELPFSRSRVIYVPPDSHSFSETHFTLCIPIDQPYSFGFEDLSQGVYLALSWISGLEERNFAVAFLGGEFTPEMQWGSLALAASGLIHENAPALYFASFKNDARPKIINGSLGRTTPRRILKMVLGKLADHEIDSYLPILNAPTYRLNTDHSQHLTGALLNRNIPTIGFELGPPALALSGQPNIPVSIGKHGYLLTTGTASGQVKIPENLENAILNTIQTPLPDGSWEELYAIVPNTRGSYSLIAEQWYIISVLVFSAFILLIASWKRRLFIHYLQSIIQHFWLFLVVFAILIVSLSIATGVLLLIPKYHNFKDFWEHYPLLFIISKTGLAIIFCLIFMRIFERIPHITHGRFFSAAAVLSSMVGGVVLSSINFAYAYTLIFIISCTVAFANARTSRMKSIFLLITPIGLIIPLSGALFANDLFLLKRIIFDFTTGNLLIALLTLPIFLMSIRLHLFFVYQKSQNSRILLRLFFATSIFTTTAVLIILLMIWPFNEVNPQKAEVQIQVDYPFDEAPAEYHATVTVDSPAPLPEAELSLLGHTIKQNQIESIIIPADIIPEIRGRVSTRKIQSRTEFILEMDGELLNANLEYSLHSDIPIFFHYSDLPVKLSSDRLSGIFDPQLYHELPSRLTHVAAGLENAYLSIKTEFPVNQKYLQNDNSAIQLTGKVSYNGLLKLIISNKE